MLKSNTQTKKDKNSEKTVETIENLAKSHKITKNLTET